MSFHFRPREDFSRIIELTPALRRDIEATVEQLIGILDLFDCDADFEGDTDSEPSLGWIGSGDERPGRVLFARDDRGDDREAEDEHGGDILDEAHDGGDDEEEDHRFCDTVS